MLPRTPLVTPSYHVGVVESAGRWPPLGLLYLAGALRERGFPTEVYDAMSLEHSYAQVRQHIEASRPSIVATTAYTCSYYAALGVLRIAKEVNPGVITVLGGGHPTFCYEDALKNHGRDVDFVVRGEGESTLPELVAALARVPGLAFLHETR